MLVSFSVSNYRSIDDAQTLSMLPTSKSSRHHQTGVSAEPRLLRLSAIYGANGSGKTNFVKAIDAVRHLVAESATFASDDRVVFDPFLFRGLDQKESSHFEICFIHSKRMWEYSFNISESGFDSERLRVRESEKGSKYRTLFRRSMSEVKQLSKSLAKYRVLLGEQTNDNQLFISKLDQGNDKVTRPAFHWITQKLRVLAKVESLAPTTSAKRCDDAASRTAIIELLKSFDVKLDDVSVSEEEVEIPPEIFSIINKSGAEFLENKKLMNYDISFIHHVDDSRVALNLDDESEGTQNLFRLAAPLLDTLRHGFTLLIDELNQTLHTRVLQQIVDLFVDPQINSNGAQLIFTSHDTIIMNGLNRDEIWLFEKDVDGSSELIGLSEFKDPNDTARRRAAFGRRYLDGRFGGLPYTDLGSLSSALIAARDAEAETV